MTRALRTPATDGRGAFGRHPQTGKLLVEKGIIAIGQFGIGFITIAQFGVGLLLGVGQAALGLHFGLGQFATGITAIGQLALGKWVLAQAGAG